MCIDEYMYTPIDMFIYRHICKRCRWPLAPKGWEKLGGIKKALTMKNKYVYSLPMLAIRTTVLCDVV